MDNELLELALLIRLVNDFTLNGSSSDQAVHNNRLRLTKSMSAILSLQVSLRVPIQKFLGKKINNTIRGRLTSQSQK